MKTMNQILTLSAMLLALSASAFARDPVPTAPGNGVVGESKNCVTSLDRNITKPDDVATGDAGGGTAGKASVPAPAKK